MSVNPDVLDAPGDKHPYPITGAVRVEHLSYRYPGDDRLALGDVSFVLRSGGTLGVMGRTGSGKTTLCNCRILYNAARPVLSRVASESVDTRRRHGSPQDNSAFRLVPRHPFLHEIQQARREKPQKGAL